MLARFEARVTSAAAVCPAARRIVSTQGRDVDRRRSGATGAMAGALGVLRHENPVDVP